MTNKRICRGCSQIYIKEAEKINKRNYCSEKCTPKKLNKQQKLDFIREESIKLSLKLQDFGFSKYQVEKYINNGLCGSNYLSLYFLKCNFSDHKMQLFKNSDKIMKLKILRQKKINQYELDLIYK